LAWDQQQHHTALLNYSLNMLDYSTSLQNLAYTLGVVGLAFSFLVYQYQGYIIYPAQFPEGSRQNVDTPSIYKLPYENITLTTSDGVKLNAYLIMKPTEAEAKEAPTILYFHANAGNMGHRLPVAKILYHRYAANVFLLSYRGYGLSEGTPDEHGLQIDAQTALDYLLQHPVLKNTRIVLYGQSLGGAVAIDVASRNSDRIYGLILENTFLSIPELVPYHFPMLSFFRFLVHQRWNSKERIKLIDSNKPILFLASAEDEIVPIQHMVELYTNNLGANRMWKVIEEAKHNDAWVREEYWEVVDEFWREKIVGDLL